MSERTLTLPELHPRQQTIVDGANRFNVLNCGRRFGKNILLHDRVIDDLLAGHPIGWGSPSYKNFADDWRTLLSLLGPIVSDKSETDRRIETVTGGVLEMWTLDSAAVRQMRGRKYQRFYGNELSIVPYMLSQWQEIIRPTLIDLHGGAWLASTPAGMNDWHTLYGWGHNLEDWKSWTFSSYDNPYIDPAELDALRTTMTDQQYRQEILAEFVQNEGAVFRNLEAALTAPATTAGEHAGHTLVLGADWGKQDDFTALSVGCVECGCEVALDRFNQIDYFFQVQRVDAMTEAWKIKRLLVELNSIGMPVFEQLQRKGLPVTGFTTTQTSKAALIEDFSLGIETGRVKLLDDATGRAELQAFERRVSTNGQGSYAAAAGMHDDTVMARALMYRLLRETKPINNVKIQRMKKDYAALRSVLG